MKERRLALVEQRFKKLEAIKAGIFGEPTRTASTAKGPKEGLKVKDPQKGGEVVDASQLKKVRGGKKLVS